MAAPLSLPRGPCSSRQRAPQPREWVQPGRPSELTHLFGVLSRHVDPWLPPRGTSCISSLLFQTAVFSLYLKSSREQKKKKNQTKKERSSLGSITPPNGCNHQLGLGWAGLGQSWGSQELCGGLPRGWVTRDPRTWANPCLVTSPRGCQGSDHWPRVPAHSRGLLMACG